MGEQLANVLISSPMARRPDREKAEILSEKDLKDLRYNLAHLIVTAVRDFYERAYHDCRLVYNRLPSPKANADVGVGMETVVEMALISEGNPHESCCCTSS